MSSLNQTAVVVPGNPYAAPGSYPGSCSDGYFVMIEPLPPGPHVIECGFTHSNGAVLDHTNEFSILEPHGVDVAIVATEERHVRVQGWGAVHLAAREERSLMR